MGFTHLMGLLGLQRVWQEQGREGQAGRRAEFETVAEIDGGQAERVPSRPVLHRSTP